MHESSHDQRQSGHRGTVPLSFQPRVPVSLLVDAVLCPQGAQSRRGVCRRVTRAHQPVCTAGGLVSTACVCVSAPPALALRRGRRGGGGGPFLKPVQFSAPRGLPHPPLGVSERTGTHRQREGRGAGSPLALREDVRVFAGTRPTQAEAPGDDRQRACGRAVSKKGKDETFP